ncbi:MAG: hypothetical protein LBQ22_07000 [Bacteroidales bacterium]|jgi:hypothetical protein|nr:hypothetical protein [Bacteroidales bacterium]
MKKTIITISLIFITLFSISQEQKYDITLTYDNPQAKDLSVTLKPLAKYNSETKISFPVQLNWDQEENNIILTMDGANTENVGFVCFISGTHNFPEFKKEETKVWYNRKMKRLKRKNKDNPDYSKIIKSDGVNKNLKLVTGNEDGSCSYLELRAAGSESRLTYNIEDKNENYCEIKLHLYYAIDKVKSFSLKRRNHNFLFLAEPVIFKITLEPYKPCEDPKLNNTITEIRQNTSVLDSYYSEIISLNKPNTCKEAKSKKDEAMQKKRQTNPYETNTDFKNCTKLVEAIKTNEMAYKKIQDIDINCIVVTTTQCSNTKKILTDASEQLFSLRKEVDVARVKEEDLGKFKTRLIEITKKLDNNSTESCRNKFPQEYKEYKKRYNDINNLIK